MANNAKEQDNKKTERNKSRKPEKPTANFPLFAHQNGQWAKKIQGRLRYFGPWEDADTALQKYEKEFGNRPGLIAAADNTPTTLNTLQIRRGANRAVPSQKNRIRPFRCPRGCPTLGPGVCATSRAPCPFLGVTLPFAPAVAPPIAPEAAPPSAPEFVLVLKSPRFPAAFLVREELWARSLSDSVSVGSQPRAPRPSPHSQIASSSASQPWRTTATRQSAVADRRSAAPRFPPYIEARLQSRETLSADLVYRANDRIRQARWAAPKPNLKRSSVVLLCDRFVAEYGRRRDGRRGEHIHPHLTAAGL